MSVHVRLVVVVMNVFTMCLPTLYFNNNGAQRENEYRAEDDTGPSSNVGVIAH
jgi:hypothetical protein